VINLRQLSAIKGSEIKRVKSKPTKYDGKDGDIYIYNNEMFLKSNFEWHQIVVKEKKSITAIDYGANDESSDGILVYNGTANIVKDFRALSQKINEIIEHLKLDKI
jgi:hypothetical protein